jgi:hypothetical protein
MHMILLHESPVFDHLGHTLGTLAVPGCKGGTLVYQAQEVQSRPCDSWNLLRPVQRLSHVTTRT